MRFKKSFRKMLAMAIAAGTFAVMSLASAEVKEYEGFGEYVMSDFETPDVAKQRAKARAEQNAMEQAGVYVESYTKVINAQVTHDEITTMTNGILRVKDTQYKMLPTDDGKAFLIHATIKADIDTDDVSKWLEQNKQKMDMLVEQNKALKKVKEEQDRQIENLKKQIATIKTVQDKNVMQAKFVAADKEFLSAQRISEGADLFVNRDYIGASLRFLKAIELNPQNAMAYSWLGASYYELGDLGKAIQYCNKAINIDFNTWAYLVRANAYQDLKNYAQAIEDYTKVIENDTEVAIVRDAYINRGFLYDARGEHDWAIMDYTKSIDLDPNQVEAYINRGASYSDIGDYPKAIADLSIAIEIDPHYAVAYRSRGKTYGRLRDYIRAIDDFTRAIELNSQDEESYVMRGCYFATLGNYESAIDDLTKAIELNPNNPHAYYARGLAYKDLGSIEKAYADVTTAKSLGYTP
ncbi:MAG: tetratricopeptide repeat protein [Schwartzia succinivorans]|nr:tetratricopeptide repeat protein [Schwartzia succinivorans]